jgi:hypothetical protein
MGREAYLTCLRHRPREGTHAAASGVERQGAFRLAAQGHLKDALAGGDAAIFEIRSSSGLKKLMTNRRRKLGKNHDQERTLFDKHTIVGWR